MGWNFCEKITRSNEKETLKAGFCCPSKDAICLRIESLIMTAKGEKLNDAFGAVGAGLLQLTAQHN